LFGSDDHDVDVDDGDGERFPPVQDLRVPTTVMKGLCNGREEREKQRSTGGEREKMGRKEKGGPSNGNKLGPTRIESGFESGLDSKTGERLNSNLAWDPHKIQVGISILT
jgi:hypothetical protein